MKKHRWHWLPIVLVLAAVASVVSAAVANASRLGWWQALIYAGCLAAITATLLFRRKLSATEIELDAIRHRLEQDENRLSLQRSQFEELRLSMQQELSHAATRLDKREQALADRLVTYHEWMEFPRPMDLGHAPLDDARLAELARKDRLMQDLLKEETQVLYDNILQNKYAPEGQVLLPVIREDILSLVIRVARIYQPTVEQPFIDASLTRVFRAISRASLQMLVMLDELPVDVRHASLSKLYGYVRTAVTTWRMYKSTEPYWPYMNTAYYLGRFALGANPVTLGAWWFIGNLGSRGAQAVAQHVINRQALAVLSGLVRIVGYEVAGIYGGNFRHRDANWIYAAELTELVSEFPLSRDSLSHALREIGSLELRSEYDRVFLYRCIATGKSAGPGRYAASSVLTMEERQAVASRLERFLEAFVHGKSTDRIRKWKEGAEERLGIKLAVALKGTAGNVRDQLVDATRSLASFLVSTKQLEPADAIPLLAMSSVVGELSADDRQTILDTLREATSYFFEHPDLDPDGDLADKYLADLAALNAKTAPRAAAIDDTLEDVAAYLRRPARQMRSLIERHYTEELRRRMPGDWPLRRVPVFAARAALDLLIDRAARARFLYGPAKLEYPDGDRELHQPLGELWLLAIDDRLMLFTATGQPRVIWRARLSHVRAEVGRQLLGATCVLTGGEWQIPGTVKPASIRLTAPLATYTSYFRPLLAALEQASGSFAVT